MSRDESVEPSGLLKSVAVQYNRAIERMKSYQAKLVQYEANLEELKSRLSSIESAK